ncbi:hypothetical protein DSO57_1020577 [Entomophthora muscae]|uniref:Uncharacterized protein n=1 Tax=Entomophthora muscae TaxID=34485 RepID=A0ACC2U1I2_9FUNG|nr:hypothetical protein DSO57_1020577 [Entomophthora muscae]
MRWEVVPTTISLDNFERAGMTINGQFPGPEVRVAMGEAVSIQVTNKLKTPLTIHWHGITQKHSNGMDGVPFVTQAPIHPSQSFTYNFTLLQSGTYWYHAHTGLDSEFIYGTFVVTEPKQEWQRALQLHPEYAHDKELTILLSETWHRSSEEIIKGVTSLPFVPLGQPDAVLINGQANRKWDTNFRQGKGHSVITVKSNTRYRLRLVGGQGSSLLYFSIPGHRFTVIEADGTLVTPFTVDRVPVNSGLRYSVILQTLPTTNNHYVYAHIAGNNSTAGVAILHYEGAAAPQPTLVHEPPSLTLPPTPEFEDRLTTAPLFNQHVYPLPKTVKQELIINSTFAKVDGLPMHRINNHIHVKRTKLFNPASDQGVFKISSNNKGVQMILQHLVEKDQPCVQHPWHLHGHSFYVVAKGAGFYSQADRQRVQSNLPLNPIFRDTFTHFPIPDLNPDPKVPVTSCGWYAIRFLANNPGPWLMHCHTTTHMLMGKQFILHETSPKRCRRKAY